MSVAPNKTRGAAVTLTPEQAKGIWITLATLGTYLPLFIGDKTPRDRERLKRAEAALEAKWAAMDVLGSVPFGERLDDPLPLLTSGVPRKDTPT